MNRFFGRDVGADIIWLLGVIAAVCAIIANMAVLASISNLQKQVMEVKGYVYNLDDELGMAENQMAEFETELIEVKAQVQWGLSERYTITED